MADALAPYRKEPSVSFQTLPGRNPLAAIWPYAKLVFTFALGVLAAAMIATFGAAYS